MQVWKAAEGCCTTAALVSLPGPARVAIMQLIVTDLVHSMVNSQARPLLSFPLSPTVLLLV